MHEDPTILTKGRYYRAAAGAPDVPSATYLVSRRWTINPHDLPHGEYGGRQPYDLGIPPHILPQNQPIGGDCLESLRPNPTEETTAGPNRGRCVQLATQELCGNVPLFTNFSLAYETGIITYYRNVPNYLTKDTGEGEWAGRIPGLDDASTRVRVTENMDATLDFRFALCQGTAITFDCVFCPDGAWVTFATTLAGFIATVGHPEVNDVNGDWNVTYDSFCQWTATHGVLSLNLWRYTGNAWKLTISLSGTDICEYQVPGGTASGCQENFSLPLTYRNFVYLDFAPATVSFTAGP